MEERFTPEKLRELLQDIKTRAENATKPAEFNTIHALVSMLPDDISGEKRLARSCVLKELERPKINKKRLAELVKELSKVYS